MADNQPTAVNTEPAETSENRQLGKALHGSIFPGDGKFGGDPDFGDDDLRRLLAKMPDGVTKVDLRETRVTDAGLEPLQNDVHIRELHLPAQISDQGLQHLLGMKNLRFLMLYGTKVQGTGLVHLATLPNLRVLILSESPITDEGAANIVNLAGLEELIMTNTQVTDTSLQVLQTLPRLKSLDMTGTRITREGMRAFQAARPSVAAAGPD